MNLDASLSVTISPINKPKGVEVDGQGCLGELLMYINSS